MRNVLAKRIPNPRELTEHVETNETTAKKITHPFWVIVQKEIGDHVRSWRYNILLILMALTLIGSLYTALTSIHNPDPTAQQSAAILGNETFLFLQLFTGSDGTLPPFITFIGFLGPLIGIALGFDAINSERNRGTLSRVMSQPIHRDYLINAKFIGALIVISVLFLGLGFLVIGFGLFSLGIPPIPEEFWRMLCFLVISIVYVAFWLNLSIVFSVKFRQAATSALSCIAIWIFFSVFYSMIIDLIAKVTAPSEMASTASQLGYIHFMQFLQRLSPSQLFNEATISLLSPDTRSLGPLTMEQMVGTIPSPLPLAQSLLLVWPQVVALIAATAICFAISYVMFMRQEIRSR